MNLKILTQLTLASFLLLACATPKDDKKGPGMRAASSNTAPWISKGAQFSIGGMESTPVLWNNRLTVVRFNRPGESGVTEMSVDIIDEATKADLSNFQSPICFGSALVENGVMYLFGIQEVGPGNAISMISSTDLVHWAAPVDLFRSNISIYNNSVSKTPTGFVMAYEICVDPSDCVFNVRFLFSTDLIHWTPIGGTYGTGYYTACPTVRYVDGYYYVFFLSDFGGGRGGYWGTLVSRSQDLTNWQDSYQQVVSPLDGGDQAKNASDLDLIEVGGQVRIFYSNLNQVPQDAAGVMGIREASFQGTMSEFVAKFF